MRFHPQAAHRNAALRACTYLTCVCVCARARAPFHIGICPYRFRRHALFLLLRLLLRPLFLPPPPPLIVLPRPLLLRPAHIFQLRALRGGKWSGGNENSGIARAVSTKPVIHRRRRRGRLLSLSFFFHRRAAITSFVCYIIFSLPYNFENVGLFFFGFFSFLAAKSRVTLSFNRFD